MPARLEDRPTRNPRAVFRLIAGEAVLIHPQRGKVQVLNEVGARLWELIDGQRSAAQIAAILCQEYETQAPQAEADTLEFIDQLVEKNLCS